MDKISVEFSEDELEAVKTVLKGKAMYLSQQDVEDFTEKGREHFKALKSAYEKLKD